MLDKIRQHGSASQSDKTGKAQESARLFSVTRPGAIKNRRVLLVDDVATTGSTISEAARVIKRAGAARIDALVLALTSPRDNDQR